MIKCLTSTFSQAFCSHSAYLLRIMGSWGQSITCRDYFLVLRYKICDHIHSRCSDSVNATGHDASPWVTGYCIQIFLSTFFCTNNAVFYNVFSDIATCWAPCIKTKLKRVSWLCLKLQTLTMKK